MDDPERAKAWVRKVLLEDLEKSRLAAEDDDAGNTAVFAVKIVDVVAEPL